jgi:hypothetical protein
MRISAILTALLLFHLKIQAQSNQLTQTIRGKVTDSQNGLPIAGATLVLLPEQNNKVTFSDAGGLYRFENLPIGRYELVVKLLGYQETSIPNIVTGTGKEAVIDIQLTEKVQEIKTFEISSVGINKSEAINELATVSARQFSVEETKRYAGALNDPGRMVQSFAGVSVNSDGNNDIVIRGNSPRGVLWRMEGIEIPNPNHFSNQGASGGAISMLSNNMMDNSDFLSGAFSAEYGNAASGVFDMRLRKGNNEKRESAFQLGVIGSDIALEGPFSKGGNSSYLINYRYSSLALLQKAGIKIVGDAIPVFQDLSFNFNFPTKKLGRFSVFGIGGLSGIKQEYSGKTLIYQDKFNTSLGVSGITHSYIFNSNTWIKTVVAATGTTNKYRGNLLDTNNIFKYTDIEEDFTNSALRASVNLYHKIDRKNSLKAGFVASRLNYSMYSRFYDDIALKYDTRLNKTGSTGLLQMFGNWQHRFSDKLSLNTGLHYMHFLLNNRLSLEPRAGIKWNFSGNQNLSAGLGLHSRLEDLSVYFNQRINDEGKTETPNRNLDLSKSMHYVIGYETMLNPQWHFKSELYFQYLYKVPVNAEAKDHFSMINTNEGFTIIKAENSGDGRNLGLEFTLERYFSKSWYMMLTSSVYDSKYRGSDKILRNSAYNGNFAGSLLAGKEFAVGNNKILSLNLRSLLAGGRRYTDLLQPETQATGTAVFDYSNAFESRGAFYRRLDLGISYTINKTKTSSVWKIDIQNVTNTLNEFGRYYNIDSRQIETATQAGIIPTLSYRIEF